MQTAFHARACQSRCTRRLPDGLTRAHAWSNDGAFCLETPPLRLLSSFSGRDERYEVSVAVTSALPLCFLSLLTLIHLILIVKQRSVPKARPMLALSNLSVNCWSVCWNHSDSPSNHVITVRGEMPNVYSTWPTSSVTHSSSCPPIPTKPQHRPKQALHCTRVNQ